MTMLTTPYRFVPLSPFVHYPEWAPLASHDHPFEDGLSGHLTLRLTTRTPLCVGGQQESASDNSPGRVHFYRTPDDKPAIPGSSLKGMLRNVLSIASFGRMDQIEDRKLSVRDINSSGTYYHKTIVQNKARAGWVRFHEGQWQLKPCKYTRVHQGDLIKVMGIDENAWKKCRTVKSRYAKLGGLKEVTFDVESHKTKQEGIASSLGSGATTGTVVVTGQPGKPFDAGKGAKKWEFLFYPSGSEEWVPVPQNVFRDFLFVHEESEEWAFLRNAQHGSELIPVFWHGSSVSAMTSMGLAQMYRLAQRNSLHDALRHTSAGHLDDTRADLPDLVFGRLRPDQANDHDWGLRGRVNIGLFNPEAPAVGLDWTRDTVLSSPKPSFHPAYIRQDDDTGRSAQTLDSDNCQLSGWKRYPVKPDHVQAPPNDISNRVKVRLETAKANTVFEGKVRFHNLRPVELGALLWVISFGERSELCHSLGMGKPYGLGQIKLEVEANKCKVIPNAPEGLADLTADDVLAATLKVFTRYMDSVWAAASQSSGERWERSPQVDHLLATADPNEGERQARMLQYLIGPKSFAEARKENSSIDPYGAVSDNVDWNTAASGFDAPITLEQARALVEEEAREQEENLKREEMRAAMGPGERILDDLAEKVSEGISGGTSKQKTEKAIKSILDLADEDLPTVEAADPVLSRVEAEFPDKKDRLNKACKKVRKRLSGE